MYLKKPIYKNYKFEDDLLAMLFKFNNFISVKNNLSPV